MVGACANSPKTLRINGRKDNMEKKGWMALIVALLVTIPVLGGCAATLKNYEQVALGMSPEQVMEIAGKPHRILLLETTGEGTLLPTPAGKHEIWFYRGGAVHFNEGKVVAKGQRVEP